MKARHTWVLLLLVVAAVGCGRKATERTSLEPEPAPTEVVTPEVVPTQALTPEVLPTPVPCTVNSTILINPDAIGNGPTDRCARKSANGGTGERINWRSTDGKKIKVEWESIDHGPYPYTLNCPGTSDTCLSGPMNLNSDLEANAKYKVTVMPGGPVAFGHIIIKN